MITFLMAVLLVMSSVSLPAEAAEASGAETLIEINEANFPDPVFQQYLSDKYDTNGDGKINPNEVTKIDISGSMETDENKVKSLKGIELFPNLTELICCCNSLLSLDVSQNPNLTELNCYDNQLTNLDTSKNTKLEYLFCEMNQLMSLNVSENLNLIFLDCFNNQLTNLDVSQNPNLQELDCTSNQLRNLDVSRNPSLIELECGSNQLTSLDVSQNPNLQELNCGYNQLTSLNVSENLNLTGLSCSGNQLTSLDVSQNPALTQLGCDDNQLTNLDLSNNKELEDFSCDFGSDLKELIFSSEAKNLSGLYFFHLAENIADLSKIKGFDFSVANDSRFDKSKKTIDITELDCIAESDYYNYYLFYWAKETSGLPFNISFYLDKTQQPDAPQQPDTPQTPDTPQQPDTPKPVPDVSVSYRTHVQSIGWQPYVSNGAMAGTSGLAKRLEGININVSGNPNLGIRYTTHVQSYGWLPWSSNDDMSGTEGEAKRLEAIKIQLTGADRYKYDVYYRVHAQSYGWLGWAKNGAPAGTAGYAKRLEAIQILVVKKGEKIDQNQGGISSARSEAYIALAGSSPVVGAAATSNADPTIGGAENPNVSYRTHVQSVGWQGWKYNGQMSGTSGQAKRLEGINIKLTNKPYSGNICYTTHVQSIGWQSDINNSATWKKDGEMAGTSGQAKRLEAIMIKLTGEMAEHYDVYYRVHAQSYGWLGWAKNGDPAGTAGYAKRLEGIQIVLVPKGSAAPSNSYGGINSANGQAYIPK